MVVFVYWGREHSFFPDESVLYVARHLAEYPEVSVIIGHHPQHVQGHAYFGNTLVLFSPGKFIIPDNSSSLCWKRVCLQILLAIIIIYEGRNLHA